MGKVTIRRFEEKDVPNKVKWINDDRNNQFLHYDIPLILENTHWWYLKNQTLTNRYVAVRYLNLRKIKAFVVSNNDSAVHMYEKLGFEKAGELKEERFINGKYCSVYIMEKFIGGGYFLTDYYSRYMPLQVEVA